MAYFMASCRMSFFNRSSIASRFSARSDNFNARRGSDESRNTNGRPDMYTTDCFSTFHLEREENVLTHWFLTSTEPYTFCWICGIGSGL